MDELPSATFRKVYATLTAPVVVTVNGHPIGTYTPNRRVPESDFPNWTIGDGTIATDQRRVDTFGHSRPAPKPGRK